MMFETRRCATLLRRGPAVRALARFLLAFAVAAATAAIPAAAQVTDPVDVYHSSSDTGSPSCDPTGSGPGESTTITFDEVSIDTPVDGLEIGDVTFGFSSSDATVTDTGPGIQVFVQAPNIEGAASGILTLDFANPSSLSISYGFALDTSIPSDPGTTVEIFDASENSLGVFTAPAQAVGVQFVEGFVTAVSTTPIASAEISFATSTNSRFAFDFLTYSSGGQDCEPLFQGGTNERLNLWIDGGSSEGVGEQCKMGSEGNTGDALCGADILLQITGPGVFTGVEPTIDTLVCNPSCANCEGVLCSLDPATKQIRVNFRRGEAFAPPNELPVGGRRIGTFIVDSSDLTEGTSTQVFVTGVAAAGANLQVRRIANALDACTAAGVPFECCTGNQRGDGSWPCGPRRVVTGLPEPGQTMLLASGLVLLGLLYRLRRRC
jgi:hypothetical protein